MKQTSAPIALFIFNRPDHLKQTLASLLACDGFADCEVFVFADGARHDHDVPAIRAAREVARQMLGDKAHYRLRESNQGLAPSVIAGVTELTQSYGQVIVVEDDLVLTPNFLTYMNAALTHFADDSRVLQVSGYVFDPPEFAEMKSAMLLPLTTTWGWATWQRAWDKFDPFATGWQRLASEPALRRRFNLGGAYDYASMLERQMRGRGNSWGVRFYWTAFTNDGLACFPPQSLVRNAGMDGSGTNGSGILTRFSTSVKRTTFDAVLMPAESGVDAQKFRAVCRSIWRQNGGGLGWLSDRVKRVVRGLLAAVTSK